MVAKSFNFLQFYIKLFLQTVVLNSHFLQFYIIYFLIKVAKSFYLDLFYIRLVLLQLFLQQLLRLCFALVFPPTFKQAIPILFILLFQLFLVPKEFSSLSMAFIQPLSIIISLILLLAILKILVLRYYLFILVQFLTIKLKALR